MTRHPLRLLAGIGLCLGLTGCTFVFGDPVEEARQACRDNFHAQPSGFVDLANCLNDVNTKLVKPGAADPQAITDFDSKRRALAVEADNGHITPDDYEAQVAVLQADANAREADKEAQRPGLLARIGNWLG